MDKAIEKAEVVVSSVNQITLPKRLRELLNLAPGDKMVFHFTAPRITIDKGETDAERIKRVFSELERSQKEHEKRLTPEQKKFAEMSKGWTANQYRKYLDNLPETKAYIKEKYGV